MRKHLFYAIIFLLIANSASAQNGYSITLKNKSIENKTLYLSIYKGTRSKFFYIDSVNFSKNTIQTFSQAKRIIGGIYRLHTSKTNKKEYVDISVENGDKLVFNLPTSNIKNITTNDSRNSLFIKQQNLPKSEENKALLHTLSQDYTNTALCEYAQIEAMKYVKKPLDINKLEAYRNNYFNSIDLHSKYFQLLPNAYSCLFRFVKTLPITNENYIKSANLILKDQNCNSRNFQFLLS